MTAEDLDKQLEDYSKKPVISADDLDKQLDDYLIKMDEDLRARDSLFFRSLLSGFSLHPV